MKTLARQPFETLLGGVAEPTPAPGGGSSCACACALGAALVEMAAAIELRRTDSLLDGALPERLRALRERSLALAEEELSSYVPVLEARRLPEDDPSRASRLAAALEEASASPLAIAECAAEVAELGAEVTRLAAPAVRGDAGAGVTLAEAAAAAAARLVEINVGGAGGGHGAADRARGAARRAAAARARASDV